MPQGMSKRSKAIWRTLKELLDENEVVGVLGVHRNAVGEVLGLEVLFEAHPVILPGLRRGR